MKTLKIVSWNLLRRVGAAVDDVAALIERQRPDLLLLQEAVEDLERLPTLVGGHFYRDPLPTRIHGLAVWCPQALARPQALALPISPMPGRVPLRVAQIVRFRDVAVANVHLSHGQLLNRRQLACVARALEGPAAIIGDFNAVGPTVLSGFRDVGPRESTHLAQNVLPFRLDRCLVRGLHCTDARALERGPSDHRPITLHLRVGLRPARAPAAAVHAGRRAVEHAHPADLSARPARDAGLAADDGVGGPRQASLDS